MVSDKILYDIIDDESSVEMIRGIIYRNKHVIATDNHIFVRIPYEYPKALKNKYVLRDGTEHDIDEERMSNIEFKINGYIENKQRNTIDLDAVRAAIEFSDAFENFYRVKMNYLKIGEWLFSIASLKKYLKVAFDSFVFTAGFFSTKGVYGFMSKDSDITMIQAAADPKGVSEDAMYYDMKAHEMGGKYMWSVADFKHDVETKMVGRKKKDAELTKALAAIAAINTENE